MPEHDKCRSGVRNMRAPQPVWRLASSWCPCRVALKPRNGRAADTREERERCRKWRRAALCAFVDDGPRRPWWGYFSLSLCV